VNYDISRTGLVLVDPYNDFLSDEGRLWPRLKEVAEYVGLREHLRELLTAVRVSGVQVFVAPHRAWRPGDYEGWKYANRAHRLIRDKHFYAYGEFGGEWHPDFGPKEGDIVVTEHWGISGFAGTNLDQELRQHDIKDVILAGLTAPGCVEGTGRWAMDLGYSVTLVKDATAAFTREHLHAAVDLNGPIYAERVATTKDVVADLKAS
jgi:nicotinamidase-related amidase